MKKIGILVNNAAVRDPRVIKTAEGLATRGFMVKIFCRSSPDAPDYEIKNDVVYERDGRKNPTSISASQLISSKEKRAWRKKSFFFVIKKILIKIINNNVNYYYSYVRRIVRPVFLLGVRAVRKITNLAKYITPRKLTFFLRNLFYFLKPFVYTFMIALSIIFILAVKVFQILAIILISVVYFPYALITTFMYKAETSKLFAFEMNVFRFVMEITMSLSKTRTYTILKNVEYNMLDRIRAEELDLVWANDIDTLSTAEIWATEKQKPFVVDLHELQSARPGRNEGVERRAVFEVERRALPQASKIFTVSPGIAKWYEVKYGIESPGLLLNTPADTVDESGDLMIKSALGLDETTFLFVYVGNLTTGRGIEKFLHAIARCPSNVHYAILGPRINAEAEETVRRSSERLGIDGRVHLVDPVPHYKVVHYISDADWGIIPAEALTLNQEYGLPNKLFEMIFAGLPILCVDIQERREFIDQYGYCLTAQSNSPSDMSDAIMQAIENASVAKEVANDRKFRARQELSLSKRHDELADEINRILATHAND